MRYVVATLVGENASATARNCYDALEYYASRTKCRKKRGKVVREMTRLLDGEALHSFAIKVISNDVLRHGRIQAAMSLEYYLTTPYILADFLFSESDTVMLQKLARILPKKRVIDVIKFVTGKFDDVDAILAKLRADECFQPYRPNKNLFSLRRMRMFVTHVCAALEIDPPPETRRFFVAHGLQPNVDAFLSNEMESIDLFPICEDLVGDDQDAWAICIDYIKSRCASLASFVSARAGFGKIDHSGDAFAPSCTPPFNDRLHRLPHCEGVVIDDDSVAADFRKELRDCRHVYVDFHSTISTSDASARVSMITIVLPRSIFFFLPSLHPFVKSRIADALLKYSPILLTYSYSASRGFLKAALAWKPDEVIDVEAVAKEVGVSSKLGVIAAALTRGSFCRRAANFSDLRLPSIEARRHRAMRACLLYDFFVKYRGVEERVRPDGGVEPAKKRSRVSESDRDEKRGKSGRGDRRHR